MSTKDPRDDGDSHVNGARGAPAGPGPEVRARLVREYQAEAARRPDLLSANLGVLAGDLMALAHLMGERLQADLASGSAAPAADPRLARMAETYLRYLRQVDRFAQLERRPAPAADPPRGVRPYREEPRT